MKKTKQIYQSEDELITAIAKAYDEVLADFYAHGATVIQFDDSAWSNLIAANIVSDGGDGYQNFTKKEIDILKQKLLKVNNLTIEGAPASLTINAHICRGNYKSNWAYSGSYANIAEPLFTQEKVNAFYLEYDSDSDGGFDVLKKNR